MSGQMWRAGKNGHGRSRYQGDLMDTMSVDVAIDHPAGSVAWARDRARSFLDGLMPTPAPEAADTVVLVVSEPVTNALRRGGGTRTLDLAARPDGIEAVHDPRPPMPRACVPPRPERRHWRLRVAHGQPARHSDLGHLPGLWRKDRKRLPPPIGRPSLSSGAARCRDQSQCGAAGGGGECVGPVGGPTASCLCRGSMERECRAAQGQRPARRCPGKERRAVAR